MISSLTCAAHSTDAKRRRRTGIVRVAPERSRSTHRDQPVATTTAVAIPTAAVRLWRGHSAVRYRAATSRARTVDGDVYFLIEPNVYGEVDPAPEDVSAIDRY